MQNISYKTTDGETCHLTESNNYVVVRTKKGKKLSDALSSKASQAIAGKFKVKQKIARADITILEVKKNHPDPLAIRNDARTNFSKQKDIRFAGRVLVDKESEQPVLYTGNLSIKFKDTLKEAACLKIIAANGLTIKEKISYAANTWFLEAPADLGQDIFALCKKIAAKKEIVYCEPELIRQSGKKKVKFPHIYYKQWHLKTTKIGSRTIKASAQVDKAHIITKGEGITIAVIDDGVDIRHAEFNIPGKIIAPRDISYKTNDALPKVRDDNHGTCCAGVALAAGIKKACGVAPAARLIPIRNVSELGSKDEADAIIWAVQNGADIISCSWGPEDGTWWNPKNKLHKQVWPIAALTNDAIQYAVTEGRNGKGCIILFAAGNGNESADLDNYISHPDVVAVAACNDRGKKSVYSDYGNCIHVCFPSNDYEATYMKHPAPLTKGIWTTDRIGYAGYKRKKNGDYNESFGGTSSACPGVAGVCALILSVNAGLTHADVKDILRLTADKIDSTKGKYDSKGHSIKYGYGRVNAAKAVELAKQYRPS